MVAVRKVVWPGGGTQRPRNSVAGMGDTEVTHRFKFAQPVGEAGQRLAPVVAPGGHDDTPSLKAASSASANGLPGAPRSITAMAGCEGRRASSLAPHIIRLAHSRVSM